MKIVLTKSNPLPNSLLLFIVFVAFALTSPKWNIALAPWIAYTFMLRFFRQNKLRKSILLGWGTTYLAALIASWQVVPVPFPALLLFSLVSTGILLISYVIDRWLSKRITGWQATLVFPMTMVVMDFIASKGGGGTWGNVAYLQFSNIYLMQLASVTGIWGIGFLVYWFASSANYIYESTLEKKPVKVPILLYVTVLMMVLGFGLIRVYSFNATNVPKIKMAGITAENLSVLEKMVKCHTGETIKIPPTAFQSDPELAKAMRSMQYFVEHPDDPKLEPVFDEIDTLMEELWRSSAKAVAQGAELIVWTEGIVNTFKTQESKYIEAAKNFSKQHQIWLFFPMAAIHPGKIEPGQPFIENKLLTFDPSGELVNTYFKNIPVGGIEPCFPGDGTIPVISTPNAEISPVICYDADFPDLLQQLGRQNTELLVVPSGDWAAISPIHSYMAVVRAIENGVSILRPVSKGLMIAADNFGQIIAQDDYFDDDEHLMVADLPVRKFRTIYSTIGDAFVYCCGIGLLFSILFGVFSSEK